MVFSLGVCLKATPGKPQCVAKMQTHGVPEARNQLISVGKSTPNEQNRYQTISTSESQDALHLKYSSHKRANKQITHVCFFSLSNLLLDIGKRSMVRNILRWMRMYFLIRFREMRHITLPKKRWYTAYDLGQVFAYLAIYSSVIN